MNHETKTLLRWIDNDEDVHNYWRERTKDKKVEGSEFPMWDLSDELKEFFDSESNPLEEAGVYTDLLYSALSNVSWDDIAELFLRRLEEGSDKGGE